MKKYITVQHSNMNAMILYAILVQCLEYIDFQKKICNK